MIPPGETIIETKKCRISGQEFFVTDKDLEFYDKVSPIFAWKKYVIPSPTLCPEERMRRRLSHINMRKVYFRPDSVTGKKIFSIYAPGAPFPVFENAYYHSDAWDPKALKRDFSDQEKFLTQFHHLANTCPHFARNIQNVENSDFCTNLSNAKDCYMSFRWIWWEKLLYSEFFLQSENCIDCTWITRSRNCFMCVDIVECESSYYLQNCSSCVDCISCFGCSGCHHCYSCSNLQNKSYYIANVAYSEDAYNKKIHEIAIHDQNIHKRISDWNSTQIKRYQQSSKTENVVWDYIVEWSNVWSCFDCAKVENTKYCDFVSVANNCWDIWGFWNELSWSYESIWAWLQSQKVTFCAFSWNNISDAFYSQYCSNIHDCFGCIGLHSHEHHCILNTPYSNQEYETLCWKIIDHMRSTWEWWEFFPHELSPFGYNETVAQEFFPLTEEEARAKGWNWYTEEQKSFDGNVYTPLSIENYDERIVWYEWAQKNINDILSWILVCEMTGKPFRIIRQELAFYIENSLPIPTKHPDQRHTERMDMRNPRKLYERQCAECQKDIITTYAPERPERVVCEECYRKIVY
jgi:hypothetical protein